MTSGHEEHEDLELVLMEEEQRVKQDDELVANEQQQAVEHEPTPAPTLPHAEAVEQEEPGQSWGRCSRFRRTRCWWWVNSRNRRHHRLRCRRPVQRRWSKTSRRRHRHHCRHRCHRRRRYRWPRRKRMRVREMDRRSRLRAKGCVAGLLAETTIPKRLDRRDGDRAARRSRARSTMGGCEARVSGWGNRHGRHRRRCPLRGRLREKWQITISLQRNFGFAGSGVGLFWSCLMKGIL